MYNSDEKISANEINKYCYCEYSWYYERLYGRKYIRERYKKRSEGKNFQYKTINNFKRGVDFHDSFLDKRKNKLISKILLLSLILFAFIILLLLGLEICGIL